MIEDVALSKRNRIDAYDIVKGVGIILVYIGHVPPHPLIRRFIYTFHMPLFFVVSGMLFNEKKYSAKDFIVSRMKSLLVPAFFFSCFAYLVGLFSNTVSIPGILVDLPSALWFLPVLFGSELVVFCIWKMCDNILIRWIITFSLLLVSQILNHYGIVMPWSISTIPLAASFFAFGYLLKKLPICSKHSLNIWGSILGVVIMLIIPFVTSECTGIHDNHLIFGIGGYPLALIGVISILMLAFEIDYRFNNTFKQFLILCGKNSLSIYGLHFTILYALVSLNYVFPMRIMGYVLWNVVCIVLIVAGTFVINKYAKWVIGK